MEDKTRIPDSTKENFATLKKAFREGRVGLIRARVTDSPDKYVTLICAQQEEEGDQVSFVPFAMMLAEDGNPFEQYIPAMDERFDMTTDEIDKLTDETNAIEKGE